MLLKILQVSTGIAELSYLIFVRPSGVLQSLSINAVSLKALVKEAESDF